MATTGRKTAQGQMTGQGIFQIDLKSWSTGLARKFGGGVSLRCL